MLQTQNILKFKIAIIEDARNIRARLVELIEDTGLMEIVGEASTEEEAIEICHIKKPGAIILDLQLEKGSGLGVLKALQKVEKDKRPIVIVLTNFPIPTMERAARMMGADWFLDKSKDFNKLRGILTSIISNPNRPSSQH